MDNKTSDAQLKAAKKWKDENKFKSKYTSYRSMAKNFINNYSNEEDLLMLMELIKNKLNSKDESK